MTIKAKDNNNGVVVQFSNGDTTVGAGHLKNQDGVYLAVVDGECGPRDIGSEVDEPAEGALDKDSAPAHVILSFTSSASARVVLHQLQWCVTTMEKIEKDIALAEAEAEEQARAVTEATS